MTNNLMIAGSCKDKLSSWARSLDGMVGAALLVSDLEVLSKDVIRLKPKVILLDSELLEAHNLSSLGRITAETRVVVVGSDISEDVEWKMLKAGVRGCCRSDADSKLLKQVVTAVHDGELWIRRTLTCRLIDELGRSTAKNKSYRESLGHLNKLTQREYDIAVRVGNGESNKLIAMACGITERTVKAHLTEVFQKLGVSDRLNLALVLSADDRGNIRKETNVPVMGKLDMTRPSITSFSSL